MGIKRNATAKWKGSGNDGVGVLSTQSQVLLDTIYSFNSRFGDGIGTNPEELIAAAHAGCFSMKLAFVLGEHGVTPKEIQTTASVMIEDGAINKIKLMVSVKADGLTADTLAIATQDAKENCPVSKVLNAGISVDAVLG